MDRTLTDNESLVGEECHIVAKKPTGPRGDPEFPVDMADEYSNLILLCRTHHKMVDDQPNTYTVERLKQIKLDHEKWVRESLSDYNSRKQEEEELYAGYVDKWLELVDIANWKGWTSWLLHSDFPALSVRIDERLGTVREWILSRVWPRRYPQLEGAFDNFRRVLEDLQNTFHEHSVKCGDTFYTEKFYHIPVCNPDLYESLFREYIFHVKLVEDLVLELTRAANYVCDKIREFLLPTFRLREGVLLVESGPYAEERGLVYRAHRVEYREGERTVNPYPGFDRFKTVRATRDLNFCVGTNSDDPAFLEWYRNTR